MVLLTRKIEFAASHLYHNPEFSPEENRRVFGKCNNPHGHGHNYTLEVTVAGEPDPVTGMVLDLKDLKDILEREVMQRMDHRFLNYEVPSRPPDSDLREHRARHLELARSADHPREVAPRTAVRNAGSVRGLLSQRIGRRKSPMNPGARNGEVKVELGRRYRFAASHRLHSPDLSEEELPHLRKVQQSLRARA